MISVKQAKDNCGYQAKPVLPVCGNCGAFTSNFEYPSWCDTAGRRAEFDRYGYAKVEKNLRCADHGFATKKMATCKLWREKK